MADETTVRMLSKSDCPWCDQARTFLASYGIPVTEIKVEGRDERQALYDSLGLVGRDRVVPQIIITDGGDDHVISGAHALRMSGIQSLFGAVAVSLQPATSVRINDEDAVETGGPSCCE